MPAKLALRFLSCSLVAALGCSPEGGRGAEAPKTLAVLTPDFQPDGEVTMTTAADFKAKRDALLQFVWGKPSLPGNMPAKVLKNVPLCNGRVANDCNPLSSLRNLKRVDNLIVDMELDQHSVAHHFVANVSNRRLVIMHQGHACDFGDSKGGDTDYGEVNAIDELLNAGFSVLGMYMPHLQPGSCDTDKQADGYYFHDHMFKSFQPQSGAVVKFFVEPIAVNLNYLRANSAGDGYPSYVSYDIMGLSGGGWTTTFYAALDTSIQVSVPVAGTLPLYMRKCENRTNISPPPANCNWGYDGDSEQTFPATYAVSGFLDLYALGGQGANRRQVQVLNRKDNCCFGEAQFAGPGSGAGAWDKDVKDYAKVVETAIAGTKAGSFEALIDEDSTKHEISRLGMKTLILPVLGRGQPAVDAAVPDTRAAAPDTAPASNGGASGSVDAATSGAGGAAGSGAPDAEAPDETTRVRHGGGWCSVRGSTDAIGWLGLGVLALALLAGRRRRNQG